MPANRTRCWRPTATFWITATTNTRETLKREGVTIVPPVYIHPDAEVSASVIGPHVSIGKQAVIKDSILKNTIVEQGAHICDMNLESSLIGRQSDVEGRPECMNIGDNSWIKI
jgi:glucose-1-phosphate thymidylyltransferase